MRRAGLGEIFLLLAVIDWVALRWLSVWLVSSIACLQLLLVYVCVHRGEHLPNPELLLTYIIYEWPLRSDLDPWILFETLELYNKMHTVDMEQMAKYGKCYGTFIGRERDLVISDLDMLKQILVKDFYNFANHKGTGIEMGESDALVNNFLTTMKDERWKTLRNTITPAFTAGKMNRMTPLVNNCIETVLDVLSETAASEAKEFDVHKLFGALTMDVISTCAFATDVNSVRNPDNELVRNAKKLFEADLANPVILYVVMILTCLLPKLGFMDAPFKFFKTLLAKMIKERRENPSNVPDFLQLMINAHNDTETESTSESGSLLNSNEAELRHAKETETHWGSSKRNESLRSLLVKLFVKLLMKLPIFNVLELKDAEIMAQSCLFLVAGYNTTAITLTLCSYLLALHPDVQDRCFDELQAAVQGQPLSGGKVSFEIVRNRLPYLEAVILEMLRVYPPVSRLDRSCRRDCEINGVKILKGMTINVPVHAIHHSAEHYPDPERFNPERFLPEERAKRNPLTFLPFGFGPRNCVGMRFALLELKLALANILLQFKLKPCAKTEIPLDLVSSGLIKLEKPIWLAVENRNA